MNEVADKYVVRDVIAADIDSLLVIEQAVQSYPWTRGMFEESLNQQHVFKLLEAEGWPVGYLIAMTVLDELHLLNLAVAAASQRKGLGRVLLEWLAGYARENGYARMLLEVRRSNVAALALYQSAGFMEIGVRREYYVAGGRREDAIVMGCDLK